MADRTSESGRRGRAVLAGVQGLYYLVTGIWPLINIASFTAITGPKSDIWLVNTVGTLLAVVGLVLCLAALRRRIGLEVTVLAVGVALALIGIEVIYVIHGTIAWIYLLDAVVEAVFIAGWVQVSRSPAKVGQAAAR